MSRGLREERPVDIPRQEAHAPPVDMDFVQLSGLSSAEVEISGRSELTKHCYYMELMSAILYHATTLLAVRSSSPSSGAWQFCSALPMLMAGQHSVWTIVANVGRANAVNLPQTH